MPPRGLRLAPPGSPSIAEKPPAAAAGAADDNDLPPPPADDSPMPPPPPAAAATGGGAGPRIRGLPPPTPGKKPTTSLQDLPPAGATSDTEHAHKFHGRRKTDVTMRAEYEMELERREQERAMATPPGERRTPPGEENLDDEIELAKAALQTALARQKTAESDVRKAKTELSQGVSAGGLRNAPPAAKDVHIRQLNPAQLAAEAKARREQMEAAKAAEREYRENAIFRGPEVAAVSQAALSLKAETDYTCKLMIDALETGVAQMKEERDQLLLRLERVERGINDDIARAEGELSFIDYASSQAKVQIDQANLRRQQAERLAHSQQQQNQPKPQPKSTWK